MSIRSWIKSLFGSTTEAKDWLVSHSGKQIRPLQLTLEDIDIEDIAHGLSLQCRYMGQIKFHYSVALHSIWVSFKVPLKYALEGLLHDASEAYFQDIIRPLKYSTIFKAYRKVEKECEEKIARKYGLVYPWPDCVKEADNRMCMTERRDLVSPHAWEWFNHDIAPYPETLPEVDPATVKRLFLERFNQLTTERE